MTKNEFIERYNEVTENIYTNEFFSCNEILKISWKCREYYHLYMGNFENFLCTSDFNPQGWCCTIVGFCYVDRMFAMEIFFHACLTEKWYKEF